MVLRYSKLFIWRSNLSKSVSRWCYCSKEQKMKDFVQYKHCILLCPCISFNHAFITARSGQMKTQFTELSLFATYGNALVEIFLGFYTFLVSFWRFSIIASLTQIKIEFCLSIYYFKIFHDISKCRKLCIKLIYVLKSPVLDWSHYKNMDTSDWRSLTIE